MKAILGNPSTRFDDVLVDPECSRIDHIEVQYLRKAGTKHVCNLVILVNHVEPAVAPRAVVGREPSAFSVQGIVLSNE